MNPFDIVKAARALQGAPNESRTLSPATKAEYERISKRLLQGGEWQIEEIIRQAADTTQAKTWFKRRAALKHSAQIAIRKLLTEQDQVQRKMHVDPGDTASRSEWVTRLKRLHWYTSLVNAIPEGCPVPEEIRRPTHSKKKDLYGLPPDWRESLLLKMGKYTMHYLVTACTGCRPSELLKGVEVRIENDNLVAIILGKKVKDATPTQASQGQPWRKLRWSLPNNGLIEILFQHVQRAGGTIVVRFDSANGPSNFSTAMRDAGRRAWPARKKTITPVCLRHAYSADLKAAEFSRKLVAAGMGHAVDTTSQNYGTAQQAGRSSVAPDGIEAARDVREKYEHQPPQRKKMATP